MDLGKKSANEADVAPQDTLHSDMWNESENEFRLKMLFESKTQLKKAITLWSLRHNREFKVIESRINTWSAKRKIEMEGENDHDTSNASCNLCVSARLKTTYKLWQITKWVNGYSCLGFTNSNNNINLIAAFVASYILHFIETNPRYLVKLIHADIKKYVTVDISYKKAWHGRRKAIEMTYGDWDSNFVQLPKYITTLEKSNPDTIVK